MAEAPEPPDTGKASSSTAKETVMTYRGLWGFFWPLAASDLMMTAVHPIVMAGIARSGTSTFPLAVYGAVISIVILVESPIIMLMHSANALVRDMTNFRVVRDYALLLIALDTLPLILLVFTPWGDVFLRTWMGFSRDLAQETAAVLQWFVVWPFLAGWRRICQGVLIRLEATRMVGAATFTGLLVVLFTVLFTDLFQGENVVQWAALLLVLSMAVETLVVSLFTLWRIWQGELRPAVGSERLTLRTVNAFYLPLLFTTVILVAARPVMIAGLARIPDAEFAIAAWALINEVTMLFGSHTRVIQHMVIALAESRHRYLKIGRFARVIGLSSTAALALIALTPLGDWFLADVIGVEGTLQQIVRLGLGLTGLVPILRALQNESRGILVRARATSHINLAAMANGAMLFGGAFLVAVLDLPGAATIAGVFTTAYLIEVLLLRRSVREKKFFSLAV